MQPWQVEPFVRERVVGRDTPTLPDWILGVRLGLYIVWGAVGLETPRDLPERLAGGLPLRLTPAGPRRTDRLPEISPPRRDGQLHTYDI